MARPLRGDDHSPQRWLRRLDHAAAAINPLLTMLAIGLVVLDMTCLFLTASKLQIVHLRDYPACVAGDPERAATSTGGVKGWVPY